MYTKIKHARDAKNPVVRNYGLQIEVDALKELEKALLEEESSS